MCGGYFQGRESASHSIIYMSHPSLVFLLTISIPLWPECTHLMTTASKRIVHHVTKLKIIITQLKSRRAEWWHKNYDLIDKRQYCTMYFNNLRYCPLSKYCTWLEHYTGEKLLQEEEVEVVVMGRKNEGFIVVMALENSLFLSLLSFILGACSATRGQQVEQVRAMLSMEEWRKVTSSFSLRLFFLTSQEVKSLLSFFSYC